MHGRNHETTATLDIFQAVVLGSEDLDFEVTKGGRSNMKYFVTSLSPLNNVATLNWQTQILDKYRVDDAYWRKAKSELSSDIEWITQNQLYQKVKRNHGQDNEIILSKPVSVILETIKNDFPNANVWVYQ